MMETEPQCCAVVSPSFSASCPSLLSEHFSVQFWCTDTVCLVHDFKCPGLDRVSYRNYPYTLTGPVSIDALATSDE
jgi:hypothetical protein